MKRLLSLAVIATAFAAQAVSVAWTRDASIPTNARLRKVATCADGRVYGIDAATPTGAGTLRLLNGTTGSLGAARGEDSVSCVNNAVHLFRKSSREILKNDGTPLGLPATHVGFAPVGTTHVSGGSVFVLFGAISHFVALLDTGEVRRTTTPNGAWTPVGEAAAAEQIALAGGVLEDRLYAQNFDDALFENVGTGCNEHWRFISPGGLRPDRPTVRAIATSGVGRLTVLDDTGSVFQGVISHERSSVVLGVPEFTGLNLAILGSTFRAHGLSADFTPSTSLVAAGLAPESIPLPAVDLDLPLGSTRYTPNNINLAGGAALTLTPSSRSVILTARFEEGGLELLSSNWVYPNLNISSFNGSVAFGGKVGMCGQPEVTASAATFNGNFSGVDNLFSFIVDLMNGDIKSRVQQAMLDGVQNALAERSTQLALQRLLLEVAGAVAPPPGGGDWSYIVGNTFSVTGSSVRFTVER
ncbi:MAG: hypothetical protein Q8L48_43105 [Archangium sp.]|nr:hypothetical protein [Archangium sp.]